jgi:cytochrome P450 family 628
MILEHCEELVRQLSKCTGKLVEVTEWINFLAFDAMGTLAFGKSFLMLKHASYHEKLEQLESMKKVGGVLLCAPWLLVLIRNLPLLRGKTMAWIDWCRQELEEAKKVNLRIAARLLALMTIH